MREETHAREKNIHFPKISPDTLSNLCCNWSSNSSTADASSVDPDPDSVVCVGGSAVGFVGFDID
jgi:hypothetical protein